MLRTTKPGSVVTYNEEVPYVKLKDLLMTRCCKVTRQIKYVASPIPQRLWQPNLAGSLHKMRIFGSFKVM